MRNCKKCGEKFKESEIIKEFNTLKSADKILFLLRDGYDVSWDGKNIITFTKDGRVVHAKNANRKIYNLIFARYYIFLENNK